VTETEVIRFSRAQAGGQRQRDAVISEGPLTLEVDGAVYTLLRTPGEDRELAVGFLFTEGLISGLGDIQVLGQCPDSADTLKIRTSVGGEKPGRTLVITSSCGLCGRNDVAALVQALGRSESDLQVPLDAVLAVPAAVREQQVLFRATGSAHAAALFTPVGQVVCVREDVGRHNALDKLIGYALLRQVPLPRMAVFLSGRTSLEMVAKVARARIPMAVAVGAPTAAAVAAAQALGITLCGFLRGDQLSAYTHASRIVVPEPRA
jgi:FdhD protein